MGVAGAKQTLPKRPCHPRKPPRVGENLLSQCAIERENFLGRLAAGQSACDDGASRSAGDQIEESVQPWWRRRAPMLLEKTPLHRQLELMQHRRGVQSLDAAAIDRQDLENPAR